MSWEINEWNTGPPPAEHPDGWPHGLPLADLALADDVRRRVEDALRQYREAETAAGT